MLTVFPPATVVGFVAILMVSTKPLAVPVLLPMLIVRAAAGLILPRPIVVTRVLLPRARVAVPAVPTPDKILTVVEAAVAALAMLIVSPAVDWPKVRALVLAVDPRTMPLLLVVPILMAPLVPACIEMAVPPVPPWIKVVVAAVVLPMVRPLAFADPRLIVPVVPLVTVPASIVIDPELPLVVELPEVKLMAPVFCVALPDLKVTAPELELLPVTLPERTVRAVEGVEPAVWSAVLSNGAWRLVAK